jgi:hypothetical protein
VASAVWRPQSAARAPTLIALDGFLDGIEVAAKQSAPNKHLDEMKKRT